METLSPTPPVLCLSATKPGAELKSIRSPDSNITFVRESVSSVVIPLMKMAMSRADI